MHVTAWPQRAAVNGIAHIDGLERQRHFQKLLQLRHTALVVLAFAGDRKDDVIVVKAFGVAVPMKGVCHAVTFSGFSVPMMLVIRPSPTFVLARSSL